MITESVGGTGATVAFAAPGAPGRLVTAARPGGG
jgi:hypothetical protein